MIEKLDTKEILRYLGYPADKMPDAETAALVERCSRDLLSTARPKHVAELFCLDWQGDEPWIADSRICLAGKAISKHLAGCTRCVILAATLGIEADRLIKKSQLSSMTAGLVMDACATTMIEAVCDAVETDINQTYGKCNFRFSPGYGDLPITLQKDLLSLLQAEKKIGLYANAANLLIPGKSVTAILGVTDREEKPKNKCDLCPNKERCAFCRYGNKA